MHQLKFKLFCSLPFFSEQLLHSVQGYLNAQENFKRFFFFLKLHEHFLKVLQKQGISMMQKFCGPLSWESKIMARFWKGSQNKKIESLSTEYTWFHENSPYISATSWMSLALENDTWECTFLSTSIQCSKH